MKKKYEAPSVSTVFFQLKERLMDDETLDEDFESTQSGEDW